MKKVYLFWTVLIFQCLAFELHGDTVVGIHGFLTNWHSMKPIKNVLERGGYEVRLWFYPSRRKFIEEHACELVLLLQEIASQCPGRPIHFVTHSIGALVLRAALNTPSCPPEAKMGRALLLAPPNQGSRLAREFRDFFPIAFAMGDYTGWELMHYDPCQISCLGEFPPTMQVLVVAGTKGCRLLLNEPNDGYLAVQETYLNTPYLFASFPISHGELLTARPVLCCMKKFFSQAPGPLCTNPG